GERVDVLAVAADVGRYERIDRSDLKIVQVESGPEIDTVPAEQVDDVVGRIAAVDLVHGSLLTPDQLIRRGERVVGPGEAVVGAGVKPGELPPDGMRPGSDVLAVLRPAPGVGDVGGGQDQADVVEVQGWLLSLGNADRATGDRSLSLVVPRSQAAGVT